LREAARWTEGRAEGGPQGCLEAPKGGRKAERRDGSRGRKAARAEAEGGARRGGS